MVYFAIKVIKEIWTSSFNVSITRAFLTSTLASTRVVLLILFFKRNLIHVHEMFWCTIGTRLIFSQSTSIEYIIILLLQPSCLYRDVWQKYSKDYFNLFSRIYCHPFENYILAFAHALEWFELLFELTCASDTILVLVDFKSWFFNNSSFICLAIRSTKISFEYILK